MPMKKLFALMQCDMMLLLQHILNLVTQAEQKECCSNCYFGMRKNDKIHTILVLSLIVNALVVQRRKRKNYQSNYYFCQKIDPSIV